MSTGREKDQKDFDLEQIVRVIDSALESDDQRIKDALRALMTITVLCTAEHPNQMLRNGPLARVFEDMRNLNQRLSGMERDLDNVKMRIAPHPAAPFGPAGSPSNTWTGTPTTIPPWTGTNPNSPKPMWGTSWSAGDDPGYKGASAEEFIKSLEGR